MTQTVKTTFGDASRKEYDADCATAASPEQKPGRIDNPAQYLTPTVEEGGATVPKSVQAC